ncbi:MAG: DUF2393 domain-containing protein [Epsilonproteobacteria bacterium]|nr:DUF2393 domain-containing protein [Campylobacterota bacterium]
MITLFNYWHFVLLGVIFIIFLGGILASFKQENKKLILPMLFSVSLICLLLAGFSIVAVDKYTKKVKLYKLKNKRLLSIEKIIYTGIVKNEGNYKIGKVKVEIKIVNKGHATGNVKGGNFYKPSGFFDFFSGGSNTIYKPQTVTKEFVVAKNLKPGSAKAFRIYFDYPPYFKSVSQFVKVYGH